MNKSVDFTIYSDGGSRGNPGFAAYGFVILNSANEKIYEEGKTIGIATNNVAEYMGIIKGLEWITKHALTKNLVIECRLDSQLVARQLAGVYKIKQDHLRNLFFQAKEFEQQIEGSVSYHSIPREHNKAADRMVNLALDQQL